VVVLVSVAAVLKSLPVYQMHRAAGDGFQSSTNAIGVDEKST
jgi:hypothetical protein